jgi:hypothetical protein
LIRNKSLKDEEFSEFRVGLDHLALAVQSRAWWPPLGCQRAISAERCARGASLTGGRR